MLVSRVLFGDKGPMQFANVIIHSSQFPQSVHDDLLESLRTRRVNHKFHYDSIKQTQKWLALHQAWSPSRTDPDCALIYDRSFEAAAARIGSDKVHLIGIGCGGGQKDARLLTLLKSRGKAVSYAPCDVSVAMVLVARATALAIVPEKSCIPMVFDFSGANDLARLFDEQSPVDAARLITFFGMIPNFEPDDALSKLGALLRGRDTLLFSANLTSEKDYETNLTRVLPQYDNALTRDWLMTFLTDLGFEESDGELRFEVESDPASTGLKRFVASFQFTGSRRIAVQNRNFAFSTGDSIRLFFSYRYTPARMTGLLERHGFEVLNQWITRSEEEGVFLCRRD